MQVHVKLRVSYRGSSAGEGGDCEKVKDQRRVSYLVAVVGVPLLATEVFAGVEFTSAPLGWDVSVSCP